MNLHKLIRALDRKGETLDQIAKELNLERNAVKNCLQGVR